MTRERIEQAARDHATEPIPYNLGISVGNDIKRASFIAGAKSRDDEITELVEALRQMHTRVLCAYNFIEYPESGKEYDKATEILKKYEK